MTWKSKRLFLAAAVALALVVAIYSINLQSLRHTHAMNMAQAEQFKRDFEGRFAAGATLSSVEDYLQTRRLDFSHSMGWDESTKASYVRELMIVTARERSVEWGCGTVTVGVLAEFTPTQVLEKFRASWWSFDCL